MQPSQPAQRTTPHLETVHSPDVPSVVDLQVGVRDVRAGLASAAFVGSPAQDLRLVGVTGTNGKGTVALLLRSMLEADKVGGGRREGYIRTLNADATTPVQRGPGFSVRVARSGSPPPPARAVQPVSNALAAGSTAEALGVPGPAIVAAVRAAILPPGRLERVEAGQDFES